MQTGTTKGRGLYNEPSAAMQSGPYHNTIQYLTFPYNTRPVGYLCHCEWDWLSNIRIPSFYLLWRNDFRLLFV